MRKGNRFPMMFDTNKGEITYGKLSKADFADILYNYACLKEGHQLTTDEYSDWLIYEQ